MIRFVILAIVVAYANAQCATPSITTVSGSAAPSGEICPGQLIFEDDFESIDLSKWQRENTLSGGGVSIWNLNNLI